MQVMVLKFYMWIADEKLGDLWYNFFFFLSELFPFLKLQSCEQDTYLKKYY